MLLIFFGLNSSTQARGKPMYFLVCNLFQKSTFNNFQQLNSLHFAILTSWSYLFHFYIVHCEILGSYLQQPHQHHVFRAHFEAEPHSQEEGNKYLGIMEKELNELVVRLTKEHEVECARPEKNSSSIKRVYR